MLDSARAMTSKSSTGTAIVRLVCVTEHLKEKQQVADDLRALDYVRLLELI
jgi:hypothetical protein